jgi:hypothetical protein
MPTRTLTDRLAATVLVVACAAGSALGSLVHVTPGPEPGHASIFASYYSPGTSWTAWGDRRDSAGRAVDFSNGELIATRVDDAGIGGLLNASVSFGGASDDQRWSASGDLHVRAVAKYAGWTKAFGFVRGGSGTEYEKLFDVGGDKMGVRGEATVSLAPGEALSWVWLGTNGPWFSVAADNPDGLDHMLTYQVSGLNDDTQRWMLFWEDKPGGGDMDYNDLVVEVTADKVIPEPGPVVLLVVGWACYMARRRMA